jgi:integrase
MTTVRVRFGTTRKRFDVVSEARVAAFRQMAQALGDAENVADERAERILKDAATGTDAEFLALQKWVAELTNDPKLIAKPIRAGGAVTFRDVGEDWTDGKLHKKWPDHVKLKKTFDQDEGRLARLYKTIGDVALSEFTLEDAERAMAAIDSTRSSATRRHYAQLISKVLRLAVYPLKIIERSPLPVGFLPKVKNAKAKSYLYPSEDGQLLASENVPVARRLFWGFLAREGLRKGEALALTWADLDLERGAVRLDSNKTDDPRAWALTPGVARALATYKPDGVDAGTSIFAGLDHGRLAEVFRSDLCVASVERPELTERSANRRPIRAHDLRATFVTLALANGKTEAWVADRTGHKSSAMINKYRRQARQAAELKLGELAPLDEAIDELSQRHPTRAQWRPGPALGPEERPAVQTPARNLVKICGEGGIRTLGTVTRTHDFQSCTFGHSVTSPEARQPRKVRGRLLSLRAGGARGESRFAPQRRERDSNPRYPRGYT